MGMTPLWPVHCLNPLKRVVIATYQASSGLTKTAGYVVLVFAAVGVYLFFSSASQATRRRSAVEKSR